MAAVAVVGLELGCSWVLAAGEHGMAVRASGLIEENFDMVGEAFDWVGVAFELVEAAFELVGAAFDLMGAAFDLMGATFELVGATVKLVGAGSGLLLEVSYGAVVRVVKEKQVGKGSDHADQVLVGTQGVRVGCCKDCMGP